MYSFLHNLWLNVVFCFPHQKKSISRFLRFISLWLGWPDIGCLVKQARQQLYFFYFSQWISTFEICAFDRMKVYYISIGKNILTKRLRFNHLSRSPTTVWSSELDTLLMRYGVKFTSYRIESVYKSLDQTVWTME